MVQLTLGSGTTGTVVASGSGLVLPAGIVIDDTGAMYISDNSRSCVMKFVSGTGTTVCGLCGTPDIPLNRLYKPTHLFLDINDNLYVSDSQNARILKFTSPTGSPNGSVVAGNNGMGSNMNQV